MKFQSLNEVFTHSGVFQLDVLEPLSVVNNTKFMRWRAFYRVPVDVDIFVHPRADYRFVDGDTPSEAVIRATQLYIAAKLRGSVEA